MKISRILHAGYVFEHQGVQIAFDPIFENPFSRNCYAFPDVSFDHQQIKDLKFQAVFISHYHDDHFSLDSLNLLDRSTPIYMFCIHPVFFTLLKELGFKTVHSLTINTPVEVGPFIITPHQALDADVDSLFQIQADDLNILNVVDSWIDPDTMKTLTRFSPWDMVFWPFQTMREIEVLSPYRESWEKPELPHEWIPQLQALNAKYIVPSSCQFKHESWSWYNHALFPISYSYFQNWVKTILPETEVVRMNPSTSFLLDKSGIHETTSLSWVIPKGEQNIDYSTPAKFEIPTTASIAKNFPPLTLEQEEKVLLYCREGLLEKYQQLGIPTEPFFEKPRVWRLSLFDEQGQALHFYYDLNAEHIVLRDPCPYENLSWSTEVPIAKLYAALDQGESLTSMYVRINGKQFSSKVENDLNAVDIIQDPLLRCLFSVDVDSYQRAQLRRIRNRLLC